MLQTIRDKITGWVASLFLGAIAIVFVFWGIDFQSGAASYAAKVDGQSIPAETVRRAWQQRQSQLQQMLRNELPPDMAKSQQTALLDQYIKQTLLTQRANDLGYKVSDEALAKRVMEIPQFQVDGKFSPDRYNGLLRSSGSTETQFEADLQAELLLEQLQNGVVESAFTVPYELERRYALEKQQREVEYALIASNDFAATANVTDDADPEVLRGQQERLSAARDGGPAVHRADPRAGGVESRRERAGAEGILRQVKERFESPERRQGRHILITATDGLDDAAAQKKAQELTDKAKGGADFAQLAKENSKDPGSAEQGGDLGWRRRACSSARSKTRCSACRSRRDPRAGEDAVRLSRAQAGEHRGRPFAVLRRGARRGRGGVPQGPCADRVLRRLAKDGRRGLRCADRAGLGGEVAEPAGERGQGLHPRRRW